MPGGEPPTQNRRPSRPQRMQQEQVYPGVGHHLAWRRLGVPVSPRTVNERWTLSGQPVAAAVAVLLYAGDNAANAATLDQSDVYHAAGRDPRRWRDRHHPQGCRARASRLPRTYDTVTRVLSPRGPRGRHSSSANRCQRWSKPLTECSPYSLNRLSPPSTRARTVDDTAITPWSAACSTRAARLTAVPVMSPFSRSSTSPLWRPQRISIASSARPGGRRRRTQVHAMGRRSGPGHRHPYSSRWCPDSDPPTPRRFGRGNRADDATRRLRRWQPWRSSPLCR